MEPDCNEFECGALEVGQGTDSFYDSPVLDMFRFFFPLFSYYHCIGRWWQAYGFLKDIL